MPNARWLPIVLLVAALAAALWLLLEGSRPGTADRVAQPEAEAPDPAAAGEPVPATQLQPPDAGTEAESRVPVEIPPAPAAPGAGAALTGQVVDDAGAPVAGAAVAVTPGLDFDAANPLENDLDLTDPSAIAERMRAHTGQRVRVETDADGRFRVVPKGSSRAVDLRVIARGHAVLEQHVQRPAGADVDLGTLALRRGAIVSGRVLDPRGQGVTGATVARSLGPASLRQFEEMEPDIGIPEELRGAGDSSMTDAEGRFELAHVAPGEFALRARHPDHPLARLEGLSAAPGQTLSDLRIVVAAGATIRGRVTGLPDGIKGVRVLAAAKRDAASPQEGMMGWLGAEPGELLSDMGMSIGERTSAAGADGSFLLRGLHADRTYRVWAVQSGRGFAGSAPCSQQLEVASGSLGVELRYEAGVTVTLRVLDGRSGAPVERLWVGDRLRGSGGIAEMMPFAPGAGSRSRNYPDGRVTIANLRPKQKQTLSLKIEALGFKPLSRDGIALPAVGAIDLGDLRLEPAPMFVAEVSDGGRPVQGASVRLREAGERGANRFMMEMQESIGGGRSTRSGQTDAEGRCTLNSIPGAQAVLTVESKEHAPYSSEPLTLPATEDYRHRAQLVRGGAVEVTLVEPDGATVVASVDVEHLAPGDRRDRRRTDAAGRATFERLAPGAHRFRPGGRSGGPQDNMFFEYAALGETRSQGTEPGWETVEVQDGVRAELRLSRNPMATLTGIVRENGVPLGRARVSLLKGPGDGAGPDARGQLEAGIAEAIGDLGGTRAGAGRTEEDGRYRLKDLAPGEHRLQVTHRSRAMPAVVRVSLRAGENVFDVDLDLTVLRGTVTDPDGKPIEGASVEARPAAPASGDLAEVGAALEGGLGGFELPGFSSGPRAKADAGGRYELRGVQADAQVVVRASAKGFAPSSSAPVTPARGSATEGVDLKLGIAGAVRVTAAVQGPFAAVTAVFEGEEPASVRRAFGMMRNGSATLQNLRPGRWKVRLDLPGQNEAQERVVEVVAGRTVEVAF